MKINWFLFAVVTITFSQSMVSCHALKSISGKDNSATTKSNKQAANDRKFIDNIEMRPGGVVTSKHKTSGIKKNQAAYRYTDKVAGNMEEVNWLQYKYAIITDAEVEKLSNILLLKQIDDWWGTKYCIGGESKSGVDCSGFTGTIFREVYKIQLPRTAQDQYNSCDKVSVEDLKEGDLLFFHTSGREVSHVGIYLINNKFVHSSTSEGVTISDLTDNYWQPRFISAGRVRGLF